MSPVPATRPWITAGVLSVAIVLSACGGAKARYTSHIERGKQYLAAGNLDKASIEFRNALQVQPKAAEALYLNARVAEQRGNIRDALGLYQAAIEAKPDFDAARASLGKVFIFAGAPERAVALVEPALVKHPDDPDLLAVRGAARHSLKNDEGARADAERAVKLAPANESAVALLAGLYSHSGENERAEGLVNEAIRKSPDSVDLREVLVSLYMVMRQADKAEAQLRKLIELRPTELVRRYRLVAFYAANHKLDDAQSVLEDAVKSLRKSSEAKLALAEFISSQRSREQGEKTLRDFIAREPDSYELRFALGTLLERTGDTKAALAAYNEVLARDSTGPNGLVARDRIAAIELTQGHYAEVQRLIAEVLQKNPRDNDALILRGNLALQRGDPQAAIVDLRSVLRDQPKAAGLQRLLARAYIANGQPALAEESLRAGMDAAPDDTALRVELAQLLSQTQRADQAVTLLEETVRRAPTDVSARESLVRVYMIKNDLAAARTAAEDLKTLRPDGASGFYLAGIVAQSQKRFDDASKDLEHALELQPTAMDALAALARQQVSMGQSAEAIARVQQVTEGDPKNAIALNLLGELHLATKAYSRALEAFKRATEARAAWWVPYNNMAIVNLALNDTAAAIASYEAGLKASPAEPQLVGNLAALEEKLGRVDDAIARYDTLYKSNPHLQFAANNLAMLLVTHKKDERSLSRARELTAGFAASDNGALLDTHGWVCFKLGQNEDALAALQRAIGRDPQSPVIRYHLAMAQLKAGQRDQARSNLETALAGAPSFAGSEEARAVLAGLKGRSG